MSGYTNQRLKNMPLRSLMPNKSYKIGFVLDDSLDRPDGVQQYVITLGEWLRMQGHDVHYLVSATRRRDLAHVHELAGNIGVSFNGNRMRTPLPAERRRIRAFLKQESFDVLHVQMPYSPLFAGKIIAAAGPDTAVVGTFHIVAKSYVVALACRLLAWQCRATLRQFDAVMSVSSVAQAFARDCFGVQSTVVPAGIECARFHDAYPFRKRAAGKVRILFLGRLVTRKGCLTLLEAVRMLRADHDLPGFVVTICGTGPLAGRLRRYVIDHGLEQYVTFEGFVTETAKPRYYASADITVFPSIGGESFGIVLIEAMAAGRAAVIAGDNLGYRSVLGDCPESVLFDARRPEVLALLLRKLMLDEAKRRHIAAWQGHYAERYDIERVGTRVYATYLSALQTRKSMR